MKRITMNGNADVDLYDLKTESWTPIPNEVVDRLCFANLGAHEGRVMAALLRKTFGFHLKNHPMNHRKKEDCISLSQFEELTGLDRRRVHEALARLIERRIVRVLAGQDRKARTYGVNLKISQWQLSYVARTRPQKGKSIRAVLAGQDKLSVQDRTTLSYAGGIGLSYPDAPTKETPKRNYKEILKESAPTGPFNEGPEGAPKHKKSLNEEDKRQAKELSAQRNLMAISGHYTDHELISFKEKTLAELLEIHQVHLSQERAGVEDWEEIP